MNQEVKQEQMNVINEGKETPFRPEEGVHRLLGPPPSIYSNRSYKFPVLKKRNSRGMSRPCLISISGVLQGMPHNFPVLEKAW